MRLFILMAIVLSLLQADMIRDDSVGIVKDTSTKLQWQDNTDVNGLSWKSAIGHCEKLTLGGHKDWRLPNINELYSIVEMSKFQVPSIKNGFKNTKPKYYWSSSTIVQKSKLGNLSGSRYAWSVDFEAGSISYKVKTDENDYFYRCVRGGE